MKKSLIALAVMMAAAGAASAQAPPSYTVFPNYNSVVGLAGAEATDRAMNSFSLHGGGSGGITAATCDSQTSGAVTMVAATNDCGAIKRRELASQGAPPKAFST